MRSDTDMLMHLRKELCTEVRRQTGAGMMDCKASLIDFDWNVEKAVEYFTSGQYKRDRPHTFFDNFSR